MYQNKKDWDEYLSNCSPYFDCCQGSKVLEIGPFNGTHTDLILSKNSTSLTLVEPNEDAYKTLLIKYSNTCEIIKDDIFFYLDQKRDFDVVVCCGVMYHLHSPFWLLELIANRINPKTFILESYFVSRGLAYTEEDDEMLGHRQLSDGWKSCQINVRISENMTINSMRKLGYKLIVNTTFPKPSAEVGPTFLVFERK